MKTATRMERTGARAHQGWVWLAACLVALLAWHAGPLAAAGPEADSPPDREQRQDTEKSHVQELLSQPNERGEYSYVVRFEEVSATQEQGQRLRPKMSPAERRTARFDPTDPDTIAYRQYLEERQWEHIASIEAELGRELRIVNQFVDVWNEIWTWLTPEEAERVAHIPGVARVGREPPPQPLDSDQSPSDVRARGYIWQPFPGSAGGKGQGKVIAILDSGIDILHPAFQNDPRCGHGEAGNPDKLSCVAIMPTVKLTLLAHANMPARV